MTIQELANKTMSPAIAYIVGMTLPLYKEKTLGEKTYIIGSVNHNPNPKNAVLENPNVSLKYFSEAELADHFKIIKGLVNENNLQILVRGNQSDYGSISTKRGFAILIEKGEKSTSDCKAILRTLLDEISKSSKAIKSAFIKGCFDGRSSIDWGIDRNTGTIIIRYFAVDVERDDELQMQIRDIAETIGLTLNINSRGEGHPKNDQIRIKQGSFIAFEKNVGFYSPFRSRQLSYANGLCR